MNVMRSLIVAGALLIGLSMSPLGIRHADPGAVVYAAGWNMAGGPPGIDLSGVVAVFTYGPSGYVRAGATRASAREGAWGWMRPVRHGRLQGIRV